MTDIPPGSRRAWLTVGLLWLVACFNYLDRVSITTIRSSLKAEFVMTDAQFGLLTTAFLVVYGVLSPFAGYIADRFSRSRVIMASLFFWSVVTWLTGHARSYDQLLATRALMGLSEACFIPAALALISDYHRGPTRSFATGILMTGIFAGSALGGLAGVLADRSGWRSPFLWFGLLGVGYSVLLLLLLRDPPGDAFGQNRTECQTPKVRLGAAFANLLGRGSFLIAVAYWGILALAGWGVVGWMPTYLKETFQLSQGRAGLTATGYLQAAAAVGVLAGGAWADRWSRSHPRGRIFVPMIGLGLAAPGIWIASHTGWLPLAIAGLVLYGVTASFADANMMPILCLVSDPRYRATGYGLLNCFSCLVGGATIYLGGWLRDGHVNLREVFQFSALSLVACAALLLLLRPQPEPAPKR